MEVSRKMMSLGTETAFEVLAKARALEAQGKEVVHLEIGEPDFDTPSPHRRRGNPGASPGLHSLRAYFRGCPSLREAIARNVAETRGVSVSPDRVVVTPGAKPIMFFVILALGQLGQRSSILTRASLYMSR